MCQSARHMIHQITVPGILNTLSLAAAGFPFRSSPSNISIIFNALSMLDL